MLWFAATGISILLILLEAILILILSNILVPVNIKVSHLLGIEAKPSERRIHKGLIPEAGGLSFALPIILAQASFYLFGADQEMGEMLLKLSWVGIITIVFGLWDDRFETPALLKLGWQIIISTLMFIIGYRVSYVTNPLGADFILGWMSFPVTLLWFLVILNAINLIDGMDGLACGITIIVSAVLLIVGFHQGNQLVIAISAFLLAGNLAFLRFNFYPARIFMGETGAMFIALNIAAISTAGSSQFKGITSMTLMIPLAVLAVPLLDVILAVFRRIKLGNIFKADKAHLHHTMLAFGFSQRTISLIVYVVTTLFGLIAIGFSLSSKKLLFSVLLGLLALMVIIAYLIMRQENK